jgi:transposase-like protein
MKRETFNVTLANGTQVPFEEFEKWSFHKQWMNIDHPIRKVKWGIEHSQKMSAIVTAQFADGKRPKPGHFGAANGQSLAVITPSGEYPSIGAAARAYAVDGAVLRKWIQQSPSQFCYANPLSEEEYRRLHPGKRAVRTPDGIFETINSAARHFGVSPRTMKTWIRTMRKDQFSYVETQSAVTSS